MKYSEGSSLSSQIEIQKLFKALLLKILFLLEYILKCNNDLDYIFFILFIIKASKNIQLFFCTQKKINLSN